MTTTTNVRATDSGLSPEFVIRHHIPALKSLMATGHVRMTARFLPVAKKVLADNGDAQIVSFLAAADHWLAEALEHERLNGPGSMRKNLVTVNAEDRRLTKEISSTVPHDA